MIINLRKHWIKKVDMFVNTYMYTNFCRPIGTFILFLVYNCGVTVASKRICCPPHVIF